MITLVNAGVKHFDTNLSRLVDQKASFQVRHQGQSKKIKFKNANMGMRFSQGTLKGAFLCGMVQRDIDDFIEKHGTPKMPVSASWGVNTFNLNLIDENIGLPMKGIDCDYFYWKIAYDKGYITKRTFEKGISKTEYKEGRLAAIGRLEMQDELEDYENGVLIKPKYFDMEKYKKYSPFYWHVIDKAQNVMYDVFKQFPKQVCMWLTDCAFTGIDSHKKVSDYIISQGYKVKTFSAKFMDLDLDDEKITWFDSKSDIPKSIHYSQVDVVG